MTLASPSKLIRIPAEMTHSCVQYNEKDHRKIIRFHRVNARKIGDHAYEATNDTLMPILPPSKELPKLMRL